MAVTEVFLPWVLRYRAGHPGVTVSCLHPRVSWGSESSSQAEPAHHPLWLSVGIVGRDW